MLLEITKFLNFLGMGMALWLGLYVLTNSPKNILSWLTSLSLWSMAGVFLNILLALSPPPIPVNSPEWLRIFLPFWGSNFLNDNPTAWLQGWSAIPAIMLWHHATVLFRPGKINLWRTTRIIAGYLVAIAAIITQTNSALLVSTEGGDPLYLSSIIPGPLYAAFIFFLLLFTGLSIYNLARSSRSAKTTFYKNRINSLIIATIVAGLAGPIAIIGSGFGIKIPIVVITVVLSLTMLQIGYSVASYSAMRDGRTIQRDFFYSIISVGILIILYTSITRVIDILFELPSFIYIFVVTLAIISHSLTDTARKKLDSHFFKQEFQQVRSSLRDIARVAGEPIASEALNIALEAICTSVQATYGLLLEIKEEEAYVLGKHKIELQLGKLEIDIEHFLADDLVLLELNHLPVPLEEIVLILPMYQESKQIGALLLARPKNSAQFSELDIDRLLFPADRLADLMWGYQKESEYYTQLEILTNSPAYKQAPASEMIKANQVEDALRKLYDFAYLGNHPFGKFKIVNQRIKGSKITHVERGKALNRVLVMLIEKLKPESEPTKDILPREWHAYYVLHAAYVDEVQNRDIMSKLYISEGTFNRTRRAAIRSLTQMLIELEN